VATVAGKNAGPILKAFVKRGANLNHQTAAGMTPLDLALEYNNREGAEILLRAGARTNFYKNKNSE
jgi:ankyrin repeat protein